MADVESAHINNSQHQAAQQSKAEEHRRAGREWLDRTVASQSSAQGGPPPRKATAADADIAAFAATFNRFKVHIYVAVLVLAQAAQPILVKNSLGSMRAPAILLFLHNLSASLALWVASSYELPTQRLNIDKLQLNIQGVKGAAVPAALGALQLLCMFSALHHSSVLFVLAWVLVGEQIIEAGFNFLVFSQQPHPDVRSLLSVALGALGLFTISGGSGILGLLMLFLWSACKAAELVWQHLKADPHAGGRIASFYAANLIREYSDEEDLLKPPTLAFLSQALAAGPVLLLGFLGLEGRELAAHEPSIPAVNAMLLTCGCHVLIVGSRLLLDQQLHSQPKLQPLTKAGSAVGTLLLLLMFAEPSSRSLWSLLCTSVAAGTALTVPFALGKKQGRPGPPGLPQTWQ